MADERDPKVSQRYRELGRQEPPRHVDDAILAASRRAIRVRLAPLVPPTGRRRWYFPVAAAAIIMLSVAVTWHMQVEEGPDPDGYIASAPAPEAPKEAPAEMKIEESAPVAGAPAPEAARSDRMLNRQIVEPPEKWLERIAALRKEGKHEEADKVLEEFRKRYPDYKIPESALKK